METLFAFLGSLLLVFAASTKLVEIWAKRLRRTAVRAEVRSMLSRGGK